MSVAYVFLVGFLLWPVIGFLGGAGYSSLLGLVAIAAGIAARPGPRLTLAMMALGGFLLWAILSEFWAPTGRAVITGSLSDGNFSLNSGGLRIGLTGLAAVLALASARTLHPEAAGRGLLGLRIGSALHALAVLTTGVFMAQALALFAPMSDPVIEGPQNLIRSGIWFTLVLPFLTVPLFATGRLLPVLVALAVSAGFAAIMLRIEALAGAIAILFGLGGALWSALLRHKALPALLSAVASLVLLAPAYMAFIVFAGMKAGDSMGLSSQSRLWSWNAVLGRIWEKPLTGHGLSASKSWTQTYSELEGWSGPEIFQNYKVVPGHPHNMPLQIWAETGLIGAALASLALIFLAHRIRTGTQLSSRADMAACMLLASAIAPFLVSFSVWNEAFWSALALAACGVVLMARRDSTYVMTAGARTLTEREGDDG